jgi:hypothetical protein
MKKTREAGDLMKKHRRVRSPETCKVENILTSPAFSLTDSTRATYLFLVTCAQNNKNTQNI